MVALYYEDFRSVFGRMQRNRARITVRSLTASSRPSTAVWDSCWGWATSSGFRASTQSG